MDAEGIEYDDNASLVYLRSRIQRNEGPVARAARFALVDAEDATGTLSRVKEKMDALTSDYDSVAGSKDRLFTSAKLVLDE